MPRIRRILIANRGEIACRIARSCHRLGVGSVAVYSDADRHAAHVRAADGAVRIGPAPSAQSYLAVDRIIDAARRTGCDAIHPGYGFLAENATFARAVKDAGLLFIGPPGEVISSLGSKSNAKELAKEAGVPTLETFSRDDSDLPYPILVKAALGGGGRGMRVVASASELPGALEQAALEAESSFGDGTLLLERYLERPRHVEVQVLADNDGNTVHLGERDCSLQRRHQKIIEEAPSPAVSPELRDRLGAAAVAVASAANYRGAGTVEFLLDASGQFYFLEVNTRLQVEHPVTEYVTGRDLVADQIRIASGEPLGFAQSDVTFHGAAIECRLCAEDPVRGFLPTTGELIAWEPCVEEGVRIDSGVTAGDAVSPHYDSLLAKFIAHGEDRETALARITRSIARSFIAGVVTNRSALLTLLRNSAFESGEVDTQFLERHLEELMLPPERAVLEDAARAAALYGCAERRRTRQLLPKIAGGFRNNRSHDQVVSFEAGSETLTVSYAELTGDRYRVAVGEQTPEEWTLHSFDPDSRELSLETEDGLLVRYRVAGATGQSDDGGDWHLLCDTEEVLLTELPRFPRAEVEEIPGALVAPMPGRVITCAVAVGDRVEAGQALLTVEAMKVQHTLTAPQDGIITKLCVSEGEQVEAQTLLAVVGDIE